MQWYIKRLEELKKQEPIYSVCGDDCAVCPRFVAKTDEELHETAIFWKEVAWRDKVLSNEEITCNGCGSHKTCSFMILPCQKERGVKNCKECKDFVCDKIQKMFESSKVKKEQCKAVCKTQEEFLMLCRSFYEKEKNLMCAYKE